MSFFANIFKNDASSLANTVDRHGGLARQNRFAVFMSTPNYSIFNTNIGSAYYGIKGGFAPQSFFDDPRDVAVLCESVTIPSSQLSTFEYSDVRHKQKMPYSYTNNEVSMTFIVTNDHYAPRMFKQWERSIVNRKTHRFKYKNDYTRDIFIVCMDINGIPTYVCRLEAAFPTLVSEITLDEKIENDSIKVMVSFHYTDWDEMGLNDVFGEIKDFINIIPESLSNLSDQASDVGKKIQTAAGKGRNFVKNTKFKDVFGNFF